jgi:hypothetical protein
MWKVKSPEAAEHAREMRDALAEDRARRERLKELAAKAREKADRT